MATKAIRALWVPVAIEIRDHEQAIAFVVRVAIRRDTYIIGAWLPVFIDVRTGGLVADPVISRLIPRVPVAAWLEPLIEKHSLHLPSARVVLCAITEEAFV